MPFNSVQEQINVMKEKVLDQDKVKPRVCNYFYLNIILGAIGMWNTFFIQSNSFSLCEIKLFVSTSNASGVIVCFMDGSFWKITG